MLTADYTYRVRDYSASYRFGGSPALVSHVVRVEVEAYLKNGSLARVRFLNYHTDGRGPGTVTTVRSRSLSKHVNTENR